jgi:hypothetical protein
VTDILLAEIGAYDPSIPGQVTLRFGSEGYNDPSAPGFYDPRPLQFFTFGRSIFSEARLSGAGKTATGAMQLVNTDGGLDALRDYAFGGQAVTVLIGDKDGPYSGFTPVIVGRVQSVEFDFDYVKFNLYDRFQDLAQPLQPNKYLGNNSLPNGVEGVSDLAGKPKPRALGEPQNVSPPCVNTAKLIYQVNDGAVNDVPAVYDGGVPLTKGADYTDLSDMTTNAPAATTYRVLKGSGYFRLGSSPTGAVTADVIEGSTSADRTAAQIAKRVVTGTGGISSGDVDSGDVTTLDTKNSAVLGYWSGIEETTFASVLDQVLGSVGAFYTFDRFGKFRMSRLEAPASPSVAFKAAQLGVDLAVDDIDIVNLRLLPTSDPDHGIPTWQVSLGYAKNWTVQTSGLNASVTDARRSLVASEFSTVLSSDSAVTTANPKAVQKQVQTLLRDKSAAQAEADRLLAIFKVRRDFGEIDAEMSQILAEAVDLGTVVNVVTPRFGYDTGRPMVVTGMDYDHLARRITPAVWG